MEFNDSDRPWIVEINIFFLKSVCNKSVRFGRLLNAYNIVGVFLCNRTRCFYDTYNVVNRCLNWIQVFRI